MFGKFGAAFIAAAAMAGALEVRQSAMNPLTVDGGSHIKELTPIIGYSTLTRRQNSGSFTPGHELDLEYVDQETYNSTDVETFGATVHVATVGPAIQTEQFGNLVKNITCVNNSSMTIAFSSTDAANQAKAAWTSPFMTIITLTSSCNADNVRVPWNVSNFQFLDQSVTMAGTPMSWKQAGANMTVDFGSRGNTTNPALMARDSSHDLSFNLQNQVLYNDMANGLKEICKSCTGTGKATLTEGKFDLSSIVSSIFKRDVWSDISKHFKDASMNLELNNMGGSFLFETSWNKPHSYTYHLLGPTGVGLPGFSIMDILTIGPSIDPTLVASISLAEAITFDYGFSYQMPDGAGVTLDLIDPTKSTFNKIDQTTFKALPFSTDLTNYTEGIQFSVAFRPVIGLGIKVLTDTLDPIELVFDVPKFSGNVTVETNVDDECKAGGDLDALDFHAGFGFDVSVDANVDLGVISFKPSAFLFSTSGLFPMSTCLPFHTNAGPTTTTAAGITTTATAITVAKTSGASATPSAPVAGSSDAKYTVSSNHTTSGIAKHTGSHTSAAATSTITGAPAYGGSPSSTVEKPQYGGETTTVTVTTEDTCTEEATKAPEATSSQPAGGYGSVSTSHTSEYVYSHNSTMIYKTTGAATSTAIASSSVELPKYGSSSSAATTTTVAATTTVKPPSYGGGETLTSSVIAPGYYRRHARSF